MTVKEFSLVVVRLFGLWVLFNCIRSAESLVGTLFPAAYVQREYGHLFFFLGLSDLILHAAIGLLLVWKPQVVANRLALKDSTAAELRITTTNLIVVCFSIAGLVFLVTGLSGLVYQAATWVFSPSGPFYEKKVDQAHIVGAAFQAGVGLWLLCRFRGIMRGIRWLLKVGRTLGAPKPEEDR